MASSSKQLQAVCIVEGDVNGDVTLAWSYPALPTAALEPTVVAQASHFISKAAVESGVAGGKSTSFFSRSGSRWLYTVATPSGPAVDGDKVVGFAVTVVASAYQPEQWGGLAQVFAKQYYLTGDPTAVLEAYLSAFSVGRVRGVEPGWNAGGYDDAKQVLLTNTSLMKLLRLFGVESVLLWTAMVLKKRVLVYCDRVKDLMVLMRTLPQLVWHRQDWGLLRPFVAGSDVELAELGAAGVYVAGVLDPQYKAHTHLYDLYVDVPSQSVHIADGAKRDLELGAPHRDVATAITELLDTPDVADDVAIKAIALKTRGLINKLKSLPSPLTQAALASDALRLPPSMQRFLYSVASTEPSVATA